MKDGVTIRHNLGQLNDTLREYQRLSGKTWPEVLAKQGGNLGFILRRRLLRLAPEKGAVRAERLAAIEAGGGVRVRESVLEDVMEKRQARTRVSDRQVVFGKGEGQTTVRSKGKRVNLYALAVQRELAVRESGRGFLSASARYPRTIKDGAQAVSRYRAVLSEADIRIKADEKGVRFEWAGTSDQGAAAAEGLQRPEAQVAIAEGLTEARDDMIVYIERKQEQALQQAFKQLNRVVLKAA